MKPLDTQKDYQDYVNQKSPNSPIFKNCFNAFWVGGLICTIGQVINIFNRIGKFAGAGSLVPITGFANSIVSPAMEYKSEGYVMGVGGKMFTVAGPVLVYGISTSILVGILYFIFI